MHDTFAKTFIQGLVLIFGAAFVTSTSYLPFAISLGVVLGIELGAIIKPDFAFSRFDYLIDLWTFGALTFSATCVAAILAYLASAPQIESLIAFFISFGSSTLLARWFYGKRAN